MSKLFELKEQHCLKVAEMRGLIEAAEGAKRDLSEQEKTRFDALKSEASNLEERIKRAETFAEFERRAEGSPVSGDPMTRELRNYSIAKGVREMLNGRLSGLEAECHSELSKGREARGLMVPVSVLLGERRALQKAGSAGGLVETELLSEMFVDRLRPALKTELLGATVLSGLMGDIKIPRLTASASASWVAEDGAPNRTDQTFDDISLSPKTVAAETQFSRKLMLQADPAIEGIVRGDLSFMLAAALDSAAIKGGGTNQPTGILSLSGLETVALGATGDYPTPDDMADLAALPQIANVTARASFLTNMKVKKVAQKIKDSQGKYYGLPQFFMGEAFDFSNQVPSNLTKSTGTNLSAILYGAWSDLFIAYWSAVDVLVNPYHPDVASKGGVLIHAFLDADVAVRHPESFAAIVDAVTG
ncbi:phage major capsid protein [Rhodoblastus acidophilus]|uniref:Phage major capsid protein n=1 Tax=Rhodoblastus acidophilus TaxID=1074 RepID=A0A6N8DIV7_RHOAC|nr:phage major capsid protein [Rhodoblastus acidophilus]MCW2273316.1 HK97 family phage major capsid protein [Rhodoblastus acidophilus]MTV30208.1 phage major capsid protein [Rhodoblastus acidophilus]